MHILHIALREVKIGFRNPWSYSFMALFILFSLSLLLINAQNFVQGYSSVTGTMLNLILYLLPLMTLLLGSFSLTAEKEEGSWQLLSTYPMSTFDFILGKYTGLALVLLTIIAFGYGTTGIIGTLVGKSFDFTTFTLFFSFSVGLVLLFLAIALGIGTLAKNRWQALTIGVPDDYQFGQDLTAEETLSFWAALRGVSKERTLETLEIVGLKDVKKNRFYHFPKGCGKDCYLRKQSYPGRPCLLWMSPQMVSTLIGWNHS